MDKSLPVGCNKYVSFGDGDGLMVMVVTVAMAMLPAYSTRLLGTKPL